MTEVFCGERKNNDIDPWFFYNIDRPIFLEICFGHILINVFHHSYLETNDTMTSLMGLLGKCYFPNATDLLRTEKLERFMVNFDDKATVVQLSWRATGLVDCNGLGSFCWPYKTYPVILVVLLQIQEQIASQICEFKAKTWYLWLEQVQKTVIQTKRERERDRASPTKNHGYSKTYHQAPN